MPSSPASDTTYPRHVGLILDGNRRWAKDRGLSSAEGHRAGAAVVRECLHWAEDLGIETLTIWLLSTDNFARPTEELDALFLTIADLVSDIAGDGFAVRLLGAEGVIPEVITERLARGSALAPSTTTGLTPRVPHPGPASRTLRAPTAPSISHADPASHTGTASHAGTTSNAGTTSHTGTTSHAGAAPHSLDVNVAIGYGGRREILDAVRGALLDAVGRGETLEEAAANLSEEAIGAHLYTAGQAAPDLLIRTSGEQRLSGFLLWQSVHSELVFTDVLWPDFTRADLEKALEEFACRERRFGA